MDKQPILSICIPIYNRKKYLERMLSRFMEDKELFQNEIQLYISDNCSTEKISSVAEHFILLGLNLEYHCNESNLGMDGNFINCFKNAKGQYVWLLGSDDIPVSGFLYKLLDILKQANFGLIHLSNRDRKKTDLMVEYMDGNKMCEHIHVWITFISANIVKTSGIADVEIDKYNGTFLSQVPVYLNAILSTNKNALYYFNYLENGDDSKNNGGYNLFKVFVDNLYSIFLEYVDMGLLKHKTFEKIKQNTYKYWLMNLMLDLLVYGKADERKSLDVSNSWSIIRKYYGCHSYAYYYAIKQIFIDKTKEIVKTILKYE